MELLDLIKIRQLDANLKLLEYAVECLELAFFPQKSSLTQFHIDNAIDAINNLHDI